MVLAFAILARCNADVINIGHSKELQAVAREPQEDLDLDCVWHYGKIYKPALACKISSKENIFEKRFQISVSNNRNFTPEVRKFVNEIYPSKNLIRQSGFLSGPDQVIVRHA